jgi:hypothetical protein
VTRAAQLTVKGEEVVEPGALSEWVGKWEKEKTKGTGLLRTVLWPLQVTIK